MDGSPDGSSRQERKDDHGVDTTQRALTWVQCAHGQCCKSSLRTALCQSEQAICFIFKQFAHLLCTQFCLYVPRTRCCKPTAPVDASRSKWLPHSQTARDSPSKSSNPKQNAASECFKSGRPSWCVFLGCWSRLLPPWRHPGRRPPPCAPPAWQQNQPGPQGHLCRPTETEMGRFLSMLRRMQTHISTAV